MNYYWQEYAGQMPKEQIALSQRMRAMRLTLHEGTHAEGIVENDIIAKEFNALLPQLQEHLRARLRNSRFTLSFHVSAPTEKTRAYSKVERYQLMAQKNSALQELQQVFGLELY